MSCAPTFSWRQRSGARYGSSTSRMPMDGTGGGMCPRRCWPSCWSGWGNISSQDWVPNLFRYVRIRAVYNAIPTDKNPYLKKGWQPNKTTVRVAILYMLVLIAALTALVLYEDPLLLALVPAALWVAIMVFYAAIPDH